jgi:hypothetical protein|tara:strand:- start:16 stop:630 length:615 start_codon:yes stop_codon:yes gene_type:complete
MASFSAFPVPLEIITGEDCYKFTDDEIKAIESLDYYTMQSTSVSTCYDILDQDAFLNIRKFIESGIEKYVRDTLKIDKKISFRITTSWVNREFDGQFQEPKTRVNSLIGGVLEVTQGNELIFTEGSRHRFDTWSLDYTELNQFNSSFGTFTSDAGTLILFPSTMKNFVPKFEKSEEVSERYSISFNVFFDDAVLKMDTPSELCI